MSKIFGYIRENVDKEVDIIQESALKNKNCDYIFQDGFNETKNFNKLLEALNENDLLVIWRLECIGRNTFQLLDTLNLLIKKNVFLIALNNNIDTTEEKTRLILNNILKSLYEYEKAIVKEKVIRSNLNGRPRRLTARQENRIHQLRKHMGVKEISDLLRISKDTVYRTLKRLPPIILDDKKEEAE